ncbi:hypothetical protein ARAM_007163 [Aspergillus rambellii]|uniref:Protein kinase domain-containing protein n=2 Tax=Aspergillus subgen. Nidulantes TaxID=2720870 RepID=A0A0F8UP53_9EURO|nr:hypothetical protein AOCH_005283 [Aspergillus ochraceoroseus]KKK21399.1 hypothetical protein ARAM_007163 [Aspergillus rambellii]
MELTKLSPSDINFKHQLSCSRFSALFLVAIQDVTYILKVHHGRGPKQYYESTHRETDIHTCEVTAYRRLQKYALCKRGIVPQFYGTIDNLDPKLYQPHLKVFLRDEYPPNGILLEYIPNMQTLHWTNYTKERMENFIKGLKEIHAAKVEHSDIHPRNMMIVDGDPKRAIWIDFDRAQTFDIGHITEEQQEWLDFEDDLVTEMGVLMVSSYIL